MTCTAKNITKDDDVEIKGLRHTADLHVHVALLKVSNNHKMLSGNIFGLILRNKMAATGVFCQS